MILGAFFNRNKTKPVYSIVPYYCCFPYSHQITLFMRFDFSIKQQRKTGEIIPVFLVLRSFITYPGGGEHILNADCIALAGFIYKNVGHSADKFSVLDNR